MGADDMHGVSGRGADVDLDGAGAGQEPMPP